MHVGMQSLYMFPAGSVLQGLGCTSDVLFSHQQQKAGCPFQQVGLTVTLWLWSRASCHTDRCVHDSMPAVALQELCNRLDDLACDFTNLCAHPDTAFF